LHQTKQQQQQQQQQTTNKPWQHEGKNESMRGPRWRPKVEVKRQKKLTNGGASEKNKRGNKSRGDTLLGRESTDKRSTTTSAVSSKIPMGLDTV
jgi:hypothetical protein